MKRTVFLIVSFAITTLFSMSQIGVARIWLEQTYLPNLHGSVLFVGVGTYTKNYFAITHNPELFETIDFVEEKAFYGSPFCHHIEEFMTFDPGYQYDHVCLFGVLGHPSDTQTSVFSMVDEPSIELAFYHAHKLLKVGGTLQLGPSYISLPDQGVDFWLKKFQIDLFQDNYQIIYMAEGCDNLVW